MERNPVRRQLLCHDARLLCEKVVLEESLAIEEKRQLDAHLNACSACSNAFRLISVLPVFASTASGGDYDSNIFNILEQLRAERDSKKKRLVWTFAAAVALAAFAVSMVLFRDADRDGTRMIEDGSPAVFACTAAVPGEVVPGVFLSYCEGQAPRTTIQNGDVRVELQQGVVALQVDPNRELKNQVWVTTPTGQVRVKGTLFSVHADEFTEDFVEVYRGVVEVIPLRAKRTSFTVRAGYASTLQPGNGVYRMLRPAGKMLIEQLETVVVSRQVHDNAETGDNTDVKAEAIETGEDTLADGHSASHRRKSLRRAHGVSEPARVPMATLLSDARQCLLEQDWKCAAVKYNTVMKLYSHLPESNAVLISLAKIELRHLNRPLAALNHYNRYMQRDSGGPLAEEALLGVAKSYRRLGNGDEEKRALARFVQMYPDSSSGASVRERLQQLSSTVH